MLNHTATEMPLSRICKQDCFQTYNVSRSFLNNLETGLGVTWTHWCVFWTSFCLTSGLSRAWKATACNKTVVARAGFSRWETAPSCGFSHPKELLFCSFPEDVGKERTAPKLVKAEALPPIQTGAINSTPDVTLLSPLLATDRPMRGFPFQISLCNSCTRWLEPPAMLQPLGHRDKFSVTIKNQRSRFSAFRPWWCFHHHL